jgi:hypothetical protein
MGLRAPPAVSGLSAVLTAAAYIEGAECYSCHPHSTAQHAKAETVLSGWMQLQLAEGAHGGGGSALCASNDAMLHLR